MGLEGENKRIRDENNRIRGREYQDQKERVIGLDGENNRTRGR